MSTWIDVGRYRVPLSSIRSGTQDRAHHLGRVYREKRHVTCMCVPGGVEMGVALRSDTHNTYYLYHLHRGDPGLHHRSCPHFSEQSPALQQPAPAQQPQQPPPLETTDLEAQLERLIAAAGLQHWQPAFLEKRTFYRARFRLIEAAKSVDCSPAHTIGESLYFPPIWDPSLKDIVQQEWQLFIEMLNSAQPSSNTCGYVLGLVKSIEVRPDWSAPRLLLASHHTPFWLDHKPSLIPFPADPGHHWLVLLKLAPSRSRHGYKVLDGASVHLSANWIPCATSAHARLADELATSGATFTASLARDEQTSWATPDFLVQGKDGHLYRHGLFGASRVPNPVLQSVG